MSFWAPLPLSACHTQRKSLQDEWQEDINTMVYYACSFCSGSAAAGCCARWSWWGGIVVFGMNASVRSGFNNYDCLQFRTCRARIMCRWSGK